MVDDSAKLNFDVKEMPPLDKRAMCIYLKCLEVTGIAVRSMIDYFENGSLGGETKRSAAPSKKLVPEEIAGLTREMAGYFCFEIVKQIWHDRVGELCESDIDKVLNIVTNHVRFSYDIPDIAERIDRYGDGGNQFDAAARNIQRIVRGDGALADEARELSLLVSGVTMFMLHEGLKHMFELSEGEMEAVIEDFFLNHYPKFFKQ